MSVTRVELRRRFSDTDLMGHINNVTYLDYLQEARSEFITQMFPDRDVEWHHVVVGHQIRYLKPLYLRPEPAIVEIWVTKVGGASYQFSYRVLNELGEVCATASSDMAYIDPSTERAVRIPDDLRAQLLAARVDDMKDSDD